MQINNGVRFGTQYRRFIARASGLVPLRAIDNEESTRKRRQVHLEPRPELMPRQVMRPPSAAVQQRLPLGWLQVFLVGMAIVLTSLLLYSRLVGAPSDWKTVTTTLADWREWRPSTWFGSFSGWRPIADDFKQDNGVLVYSHAPGKWLMGVETNEGVYRMRVFPGVVAYSAVGTAIPTAHRMEASAFIAPESAASFAGLLNRYHNETNFMLLIIDGQQRFQLQVQRDGVWSSVQPWTFHKALLPAGMANVLVLEDDGRVVRYFANDTLLLETEATSASGGGVGLAAGTLTNNAATIDFDWVKVDGLNAP